MFQMSGRTTSSKRRSLAITTIEWRITFVTPDGKSASTVIQNTPRLSRIISRVSQDSVVNFYVDMKYDPLLT